MCLLALCSLSSYAQDKTTLTKDETVNYLGRKIKEIVGHYRKPNGYNERLYFENTTVSYSDNLLIIDTKRKNLLVDNNNCGYYELGNTVSFNPKDIVEIKYEGKNESEPVGVIKVIFTSQVCKEILNAYGYKMQNNNGTCYDWRNTDHQEFSKKEILIPFLASDSTNFTKIKKALEHLRDLCKAEDDPFGE
ncbi:hypothetical protein EV145_10596 [Flavobacterium sp. 245]|nr:hypothetical protein EV145_10596 [Flavobacterium sp. 245]